MFQRYDVPAQALFRDPGLEFARTLKYKNSKSIFKKWIETYVIICNGILYIYSNKNSPYPKITIELNLYNNIEKVENQKSQHLHVFVLSSNRESVPHLKFASKNLLERNYNIDKFKRSLINSSPKLSLEDDSMTSVSNLKASGSSSSHQKALPPLPTNPDSFYKNEENYAMPFDCHEKEIRAPMNSSSSSIDTIIDVKIPRESFSAIISNGNNSKNNKDYMNSNISNVANTCVEIYSTDLVDCKLDVNNKNDSNLTARKVVNICEEIYSKDLIGYKLNINMNGNNKNFNSANLSTSNEDFSIYNESYHEDMDNFIFFGSSRDAFLELSKHFHLGCYLVRQENDRRILTVQCQPKIVKFIVQSNPSTNVIYITNESTSFKDLPSLLSYYEKNYLPNNNVKLSIPFKLRSK